MLPDLGLVGDSSTLYALSAQLQINAVVGKLNPIPEERIFFSSVLELACKVVTQS